jgi:hypothetical protein
LLRPMGICCTNLFFVATWSCSNCFYTYLSKQWVFIFQMIWSTHMKTLCGKVWCCIDLRLKRNLIGDWLRFSIDIPNCSNPTQLSKVVEQIDSIGAHGFLALGCARTRFQE